MAAQIKSELNTDVEMTRGKYGEFKVIVDGATVIDGGSKVILGVMPSGAKVVAVVRAKLGIDRSPK